MQGAKYRDLNKDRIIEVKRVDGNIAELNNGERVATERLMDGNYFEQMSAGQNVHQTVHTPIEPQKVNESNMNNLDDDTSRYTQLLQQKNYSIGVDDEDSMNLRQADVGLRGQQSMVRESGVVESHSQNIRGLGGDIDDYSPVTQPFVQQHPQPTHESQPIQQQLSPEEELLRKYGHGAPKVETNNGLDKIVYGEEEEVQSNSVQSNVSQVIEPKVNPMHEVFKKAKRSKQINVNLKLDGKIPTKEVIKMLEENFEESAIDYYAEEIYDRLMSDPSIIKDQVKVSIEKYMKSRSN